MKLNTLGDRLDDFQMARKYQRLCIAAVCFHILAVSFTNIMLPVSTRKVFLKLTWVMYLFSVLRGLKIVAEISKRGTYYLIFVYYLVLAMSMVYKISKIGSVLLVQISESLKK
jgi:hypothetical protein